MVHLDDLVFDVGGLCGPVILGDGLSGADQHVADSHLAGVALPVVGGNFSTKDPAYSCSRSMKILSRGTNTRSKITRASCPPKNRLPASIRLPSSFRVSQDWRPMMYVIP